ncbi:rRNA maturation RNase YbeY [Candidatus Uhrbacteria bacterium]|nr:rRNA maturation RNase YbeY [Candidatus Uhrbacteria bacterium]
MITLEVYDERVPEPARLGAERYLAIARAVNEAVPDGPDGAITVTYVEDDEIRRLNRMYRGKDAVTDVLSFGSGMPETGEVGDVIISFAQAERQALSFAEDGSAPDIELECTDLVVHGILHVLGFDHERPEDADRMFPLQDRIVERAL